MNLDVSMSARHLVFAICLVAAAEVAVYVANPLHTPSYDPRWRLWGIGVFRQPSRSMEPTIRHDDIFLVSAWPYRHAEPRIGDIVVFRYPPDPSVIYDKRVIGVGGSKVEIRRGIVYVDGKLLDEPYKGVARDDTNMVTVVPQNSYFVLGDNRANSADSRYWGFLPRANILGRALK